MPGMMTVVQTVSRLYVLDFGTFRVHEDGRVIGIPGYLIVTRGGRLVLVDTGFPPAYHEDRHAAAAADGLDSFGELVEHGPENTVAAQIALCGVGPDDVTDLVLTHGDIDHVGGAHLLPNARLWIGRAEWELERPLYFPGRRPVEWPRHLPVTLVEGDEDLAPGLTLLATPGHSPGHLSLLVRLERAGPVLLTADAIARPWEIEEQRFNGAVDESLAAQSAARILDLAAREGALVVYGHDPAQWPALQKAPALFD